jgi:hypothetical protein
MINLCFSSNEGSFFILLTFNSQDFALLIVEEASIESEELVPVAINTISIAMTVSNINGIVVIALASNCSRLVVEVELLGSSSIVGLDNKSVCNVVNESVLTHLRNNMERSVDVHTPESAVSRSWFRAGSIKVQDIPLLVDFISSAFPDD